MDGIIMKDDRQVVSFFRRLEDMYDKLDRIMESGRPPLNGEHYLTDKELAQKLKVSRRTLQEYRSNGILPYILLGGKILYKESDIERLLEDNYYRAFSNEFPGLEHRR